MTNIGKKRRWSGFDWMIVLLVLALGAAWLHFVSDVDVTFVQQTQVTYRLEVTNLTAEQIALVQEGDALLDPARYAPLGTVVGIETRAHRLLVDDPETQTITIQPFPDRYTITITVEGYAESTRQGFRVDDQITLRGGQSLNIIGPRYAFVNAGILRIEREAY